MLFSSPEFLFFFGAYFFLHATLPLRFRLALIVIGSAVFYSYWNPAYLWMPFFVMSIAYYGAIWLVSCADSNVRRRRLMLVVGLLLTPLLVVKYTNFLYQDVFGWFFGVSGRLVDWQLPLGISFITFTLIAYVVDVYCGRYRLEKNPKMLAGLVLFFPHLIAGPILRPSELLPQLHRQRRRIGPLAALGMAIFSVGLMKKLVFADPIGESVERVFSATATALTGVDYLVGIYGFALQIYCDFSGYTDMAIGTALLLGVRLPTNFQRPYVSSSVVEFWTRWHITLSKWLRDYLYIPLGGNRKGYARQSLNLFITMGLGGLWHGASWTFFVWGLVHAAGISFAHGVRRFRVLNPIAHTPRIIKVFVTFHFVAGAWILFRAPNLSVAWNVASGPFVAPWSNVSDALAQQVFPITLLALFFAFHRWDDHQAIRRLVKFLPKAVFWPAVAVIWMLAMAVSQGSSAKFIYFDF